MVFDKKIFSWCLFDFANSSYSAVIGAVIFPVYFAQVIVGNETHQGDLWWGRAIALSMAVVAITSPFLGGVADCGRSRKRFLALYTLVCVLAVVSFSFLSSGMVISGFILIVLANIGLEGGIVFYNAFLNDIARPEYRGRVSAWGYGVGYLGSVVSLLLALVLVRMEHLNLVWPMVAIFFAVFSVPLFLFLPENGAPPDSVTASAANGLRRTLDTLKRIGSMREERKFLIAYFIYEDGVNTVIFFSSLFAATTLGFTPSGLIGLFLVVQMTALAGSFLLAKPTDLIGPKKIVTGSLVMWIFVVCGVYFVQSKVAFMVIASFAGLGLGVVQAATRALYAQFIPKDREAEYFGLFTLVGKSSAIIGPFVFGYISSTFRSQRPAVLSVALFLSWGCSYF